MRNFILGIIAAIVGAIAIAIIAWVFVVPRLDWSANPTPGTVETELAHNALNRWVRHNGVAAEVNPLPATPENLKAAQAEYKEHCASCHGLDGSGRNEFEARFYPPVMKLTGKVQDLSDAEIYFIVTNGIRFTAMPGFGKTHSPGDIWRTILWLRHLAHLSSQEKAAIADEMRSAKIHHEQTMEHRTTNRPDAQ